MFESSDMQRSVDRIQQHMELRGLRPNTVSTFGGCAHRFLAHVGKRPVDIALLRTRTFSLRVRKSGILEIIEVLGSRGDFCRMTPAIPPAPHTRRAYDHCLRDHVVRCGAKTVARHVQIPRSTVSTWRRRGLRPVVSTEPVGQDLHRALDSSARWENRARLLAAVVRLLLAQLRASGFRLDGNRLPEGDAKASILRAISSADAFLPLAIILRILGLESGRYHAWRRAENACDLSKPPCPKVSFVRDSQGGAIANVK